MNFKKLLTPLSIIIITLSLMSCNKFLDILPPTTNVNPTTVKDFEEMLNNDSLASVQFFLLDLVSDDIQMRDYQLNSASSYYTKAYLWAESIWSTSDGDIMYNSSYSRILQMNIILNRLEEAPKDQNYSEARKNIVKSQALINRSWYYLQLVNAYGKSYDASTSSTDLGVPLILSPDASNLPRRASVAEIYNQIITDLKTAVNNPDLPAKGKDIIHPGKAAGFALLARSNLYMGNYDVAEKYADSTLLLENNLLNYNTSYSALTQLEDLSNNPEILLGRISQEQSYYKLFTGSFRIGRSLSDSLGNYDLRKNNRFSYNVYDVTGGGNSTILVFDYSVSVPEVLLIKAECLARSGQFKEAGILVDRLRSNRIPSANIDSRSYSSSNILKYVLGERRRELFYKGGLRLFDLKRLNKEVGLAVNLERQNENLNKVLATLSAGSNRYLMPFSSIIISNNSNIVQNPR